MTYVTFGVSNKWMGCAKAAKLLAVVTLFNLVGATIVAALFATTSKFSGVDSAH